MIEALLVFLLCCLIPVYVVTWRYAFVGSKDPARETDRLEAALSAHVDDGPVPSRPQVVLPTSHYRPKPFETVLAQIEGARLPSPSGEAEARVVITDQAVVVAWHHGDATRTSWTEILGLNVDPWGVLLKIRRQMPLRINADMQQNLEAAAVLRMLIKRREDTRKPHSFAGASSEQTVRLQNSRNSQLK